MHFQQARINQQLLQTRIEFTHKVPQIDFLSWANTDAITV